LARANKKQKQNYNDDARLMLNPTQKHQQYFAERFGKGGNLITNTLYMKKNLQRAVKKRLVAWWWRRAA